MDVTAVSDIARCLLTPIDQALPQRLTALWQCSVIDPDHQYELGIVNYAKMDATHGELHAGHAYFCVLLRRLEVQLEDGDVEVRMKIPTDNLTYCSHYSRIYWTVNDHLPYASEW